MVEREFVALPSPSAARAGAGGHPCQGLYWTPGRGPRPSVALVASHYNVDFSEHYLAPYVAERGVGFLGWNTRFRGQEPYFLLDHALVDVGVGVRWLREEAGVEAVVLLGNSGGGSLMAAYQSQASEPNVVAAPGLAPATGPEDLEAADGFVSLAAHRGRPDVLTDWMDAAVTDESDPLTTDPELDLWNPANGPPYLAPFVERYRAAQVARNDRISAWARSELERLAAGGGSDRLFALCRTWADPRMVDPSLDPSRRKANWCYLGDPRRANRGVWGLGASSTLRTWLSMWSLSDSQCRGEPHLARLSVPSLVIDADADAGIFPGDTQAIFDAIAATDKQRTTLAGDHYFQKPAGARDKVADALAEWVLARFGLPRPG
ncbi:MAG: alpha/beta hydrolase [Acidimicrobiales bacterium]